MTEIGHLSDDKREVSGHVVVIQVEDLKILEMRKVRRESVIEDIVGKVEKSEVRNGREAWGKGSRELISGDGKVRKEREVSDVVGKRTIEVEASKVERSDVSAGIAGDTRPRAVGGGGVP